jgi:YjbE family integral membrane protein
MPVVNTESCTPGLPGTVIPLSNKTFGPVASMVGSKCHFLSASTACRQLVAPFSMVPGIKAQSVWNWLSFDNEDFSPWIWTFTHTPFWIALGQIIIIDILLGGDNAVVIALACRKLPPEQRRKGIIYGTAGAIVLRIILIAFAMVLLQLPFLKVVGALLLVWIGMKLIAPDEEGHDNIEGSDKLFAAIKTIIVADLVMSVDNVIAIAGAAQSSGEHQLLLIVLGLLISIPIIVWGSQLVIKLMERFPDHRGRRHAAGLDCRRHAGHRPAVREPDKWTGMPKLLAQR